MLQLFFFLLLLLSLLQLLLPLLHTNYITCKWWPRDIPDLPLSACETQLDPHPYLAFSSGSTTSCKQYQCRWLYILTEQAMLQVNIHCVQCCVNICRTHIRYLNTVLRKIVHRIPTKVQPKFKSIYKNINIHSGFYWSKRWRGGSGISWTICKSFGPRFRQITTPVPHNSAFTGRIPFLPPKEQRQSTEGIFSLR